MILCREDLSIASVLGGLCLANARLGTVHGYASVLGGMFETAPHGAICAALLPHVMRKNVQKLGIATLTICTYVGIIYVTYYFSSYLPWCRTSRQVLRARWVEGAQDTTRAL